MKKYLIKLSILILVFNVGSCEKYLDINQDPDVLGTTDAPEIILPAAQVSLANTLMGWDFGFGGGYWSQYWTQSYTASQFKTLCEYTETSFDVAYQDLTAITLTDLKRIKTLASEPEDLGYYYVAEALSIFTWQIMTDVWGDVPYTEALQGNEGIKSPVFDNGTDIYADLMTRVDALLAIDPSDAYVVEKFDFIYGGEMTDWIKFTNSLKLKLMLRQSETSNYNNANTLSFVMNNEFLETSAKIDGSTYWDDSKEGKKHPMREFSTGGANYLSTNVIGCKSFIDYLSSNSDPRIDVLFEAPDSGHQGAFFGDFDSKIDSSGSGTDDEDEDYSEPIFTATMDIMIMSDWEVNFYLAEVYARANDNTNAKAYYDMAVTASLGQHAIASTDIITSGYAVWGAGTEEENIKQIAMQKWVSNANYQHIESFLERNRTKYPAVNDMDIKLDRNAAFLAFPTGDLTISVNGRDKTNGNLPASPVYPNRVLTRNINAPGQKTDLLEKIWWDQKVGK